MVELGVSRGSSSPGKGIAAMVIGGALMTANDAVLKWLSGDYPAGQIMFLRGLFMFVPIGFLVWRAGGLAALRPANRKAHMARAMLVVTGSFLFISGLRYLPLADAISVSFAGPLFIIALAPRLLGETVGLRRWSAVLIGFVGVLVIIRPTGEAAQWAAIFPLAASFSGAFRDILTRLLSSRETTVSLLFYTTFGVVFAGLMTLPFGWQPLAVPDILLFALGGTLIGVGHFCLIECFRHAEAAVVVPFKYATIVWATMLGFLIWGDVPDGWTIAGGTIVIGSGLYIIRRETRNG